MTFDRLVCRLLLDYHQWWTRDDWARERIHACSLTLSLKMPGQHRWTGSHKPTPPMSPTGAAE